MKNLKELFKNVVEKFLLIGASAGITAIIPLLQQYDGEWELGIAIVAAILITVNKYLKEDKKLYAKPFNKVKSKIRS